MYSTFESRPRSFTLNQIYREMVDGDCWTDVDGTFFDGTTRTPGYLHSPTEAQDRAFQQNVLLFTWSSLDGVVDGQQLPPVVAGLNCSGPLSMGFSQINEARGKNIILPWSGAYVLPERVKILSQFPLGFLRVETTTREDLWVQPALIHRDIFDLTTLLALMQEAQQTNQNSRLEINLLQSMMSQEALQIMRTGTAGAQRARIEHQLAQSLPRRKSGRIRAGFGVRRGDGSSFATGNRHMNPMVGQELALALSPQGMRMGYKTWLLFFNT